SSALVARLGKAEVLGEDPKQSIVVTSALQGEGKTITTVNTGLTLATRGKTVLLVDADFGDPTLTRMLLDDYRGRPGITDVFEGNLALSEATIPVDLGKGNKVDLLTRGTAQIEAADFFSSSVTQELFRLMK